MENHVKRFCSVCGTRITGRVDKRFCGDACRTVYHNRSNAETNRHVRLVNNILRRNRRILEKLVPGGMRTVQSTLLFAAGFDFAYHTRYEQDARQSRYYCYDYIYEPAGSGKWKIFRLDEINLQGTSSEGMEAAV
jgi:predicted nucleic acid-binding Zn ribbon protein